MYTSILSATMQGIRAIPVQVEVDVSPGLPGFSMVGTVNSQVREAQDRVRTALHNLEIPVPPRRITINLSPADVPKAGTGFDLPITAAILESLGQLPKGGLESVMVIGEVGLDGQIKKVRGVLAMVEEARKSGCQGVLFHGKPERGTDDPGIRSVGVRNLGRVYADSERTDMGTSGERKGKDGDCTGNNSRFQRNQRTDCGKKGGTSCSRRFS